MSGKKVHLEHKASHLNGMSNYHQQVPNSKLSRRVWVSGLAFCLFFWGILNCEYVLILLENDKALFGVLKVFLIKYD